MNAITTLQKCGYVFSLQSGRIVFSRTNIEQLKISENKLRALFGEIQAHKEQAVAFLKSQAMPSESMVRIEDLPAFRAKYGVRVERFLWVGHTPTLEMKPEGGL